MGLGFLVKTEVKVKSWLGAFPEADSIPPFPEQGLSTESVASQVSPWLFVPFFSSLTGKIVLGNRYGNIIWSWCERKLLLGNKSSVLSASCPACGSRPAL